MKISTNTNSMAALRRFSQISKQEEETTRKLSSGDRIYTAAMDPAGLAISQKMRANVKSMGQAKRNISDGISLIQVAEGTLSALSNMGIRLRELAIQAATDTVSDDVRKLADFEFRELKREVKRQTSSAMFNGNHILDSEKSRPYDLQIGIHNNKNEDRLVYDLTKILDSKNNFNLDDIDLRSKVSARRSLSVVDKMMNKVSLSKAKLGAAQNRMHSMFNGVENASENLQASNSLIRDADIAYEAANSAKLKIQKNAALSMLQITTSQPKNVLKLL